MKTLTDEQLWVKIRGLQGKVIYTIDRRKPNRVKSVHEDLVEFEGRKSHPSKDYIVWCYRLAMQHGILTGRNLPSEFFNKRISRICMALLAAAIPEQIRAFDRGKSPPSAQGLSGIEVYSTD